MVQAWGVVGAFAGRKPLLKYANLARATGLSCEMARSLYHGRLPGVPLYAP